MHPLHVTNFMASKYIQVSQGQRFRKPHGFSEHLLLEKVQNAAATLNTNCSKWNAKGENCHCGGEKTQIFRPCTTVFPDGLRSSWFQFSHLTISQDFYLWEKKPKMSCGKFCKMPDKIVRPLVPERKSKMNKIYIRLQHRDIKCSKPVSSESSE